MISVVCWGQKGKGGCLRAKKLASTEINFSILRPEERGALWCQLRGALYQCCALSQPWRGYWLRM